MEREVMRNAESVGLELRSNSLNAVRVDEDGKILADVETGFDPEVETVSQIIDFLGKVESQTGSFDEFGFAVPGLVDINRNKVAFSSQFPHEETSDLTSQILSATGKRVYLENDANAAAYGEFVAGAAKNAKDFFYVLTGAGIGGSLVLDKKVWHGASGFAGEFGFVAVNSEGMRIEDLASADAIVRRAKNRLHQDPAS
ncbi:MAG: ROK family protein, partial [Acidobacteriota bacterium]|nr:ROK family protein [Acidobacteriota bacterium]